MYRPLILFFASHLFLACGGQTTASGEHAPPDAGQAGSAGADASVPDAADGSIPDGADVVTDGEPTWDHISSCPNTEPEPPMALLPSGFCIDTTEVTRRRYRAWLVLNPTLQTQTARCGWNESFVPDETCVLSEEYTACAGDDCPQTCIDWCDANQFCRYWGGRLCGKANGDAIEGWTADDVAPLTNPNISKWFNACSSGGKHVFPYGDTFDPNACNTADSDGPLLPVASKPGCQSSVPGFDGVFDLSGNAPEWEDNCLKITSSAPPDNLATDGRDDLCMVRGGGVGSTGPDASCAALQPARRQDTGSIGFRCCSY